MVGILSELVFPFDQVPPPGQVVQVAPGFLWARMPLPFKLDHVNVYFIREGDGWAVFDTGIHDDRTCQHWRELLDGPFKQQTITRVIVSHYDPDHIGMAGWLCDRLGVRLQTTLSSYLSSHTIALSPWASQSDAYREFYRSHGMDDTAATIVGDMGHEYLKMVAPLPATFKRVLSGDMVRIGNHSFVALTADGHSPEQVMLYCESAKVILVADQVLAKITPNVSVWGEQPDDNPLEWYLKSLNMLKADIPADVLVLPGHRLPFFGLHLRCDQIIDHHRERCNIVHRACMDAPQSVADLISVLFRPNLDPHQLSFAFGEALAHVNFMVADGRLRCAIDDRGGRKFFSS